MEARSTRILGIDLLKFAALVSISVYHLCYFLWADTESHEFLAGSWVTKLSESFARVFSFSGFVIVIISFFLFGYKGRSTKDSWLVWIVLGFGIVFQRLLVSEEPVPFVWDIYPYLVVSMLLIRAIKPALENVKVRRGVLLLSILVVSLPLWRLETFWEMPLWLEQVLWGVCRDQLDLADWPLLPWMALPVFSYSLGREVDIRERLAGLNLSWRESLFWIVVIILCSFGFGPYFSTPVGFGFSCYVFRLPSLVFWSHILMLLGLIRFSMEPRVKAFLDRSWLFQGVSRLACVRSFWLAYFIHYLLAYAISRIYIFLGVQFQDGLVDLAFLLLIPLTELCTRGLVWMSRSLDRSKQ